MAPASGSERENRADRLRGGGAFEIVAVGSDAVIFQPHIAGKGPHIRKKSKTERKRPKPPGLRGAQISLDPPLRFLPQRRGAFQRLGAGGSEPHRRLALVGGRARPHKSQLF